MRGVALFAAGILVGLAATSVAQNQTPNRGIVALNHVALAVPDVDKAVEYYTKTMGFPEAFRVKTPSGQVQLVYVQISQNTFIEIQAANAERPAGIYHFGVHVENMARATRAGAIVFPLTPAFYNRPQGLEEIVEHFTARIFDLLRLPHTIGKRWGTA